MSHKHFGTKTSCAGVRQYSDRVNFDADSTKTAQDLSDCDRNACKEKKQWLVMVTKLQLED